MKFGGSISKIIGSNGQLTFGSDVVTGYQVGFSAKVHLIDVFSLQPESVFILKGSKSFDESLFQSSTILPYLEIPVLMNTKLFSIGDMNCALLTGPYFSLLISGLYQKDNPIYEGDEISGNYNNVDAGLIFGLSFEVHDFVIDCRYESSFLNVFSTYSGNISDGINQTISFSAGYRLIQI